MLKKCTYKHKSYYRKLSKILRISRDKLMYQILSKRFIYAYYMHMQNTRTKYENYYNKVNLLGKCD